LVIIKLAYFLGIQLSDYVSGNLLAYFLGIQLSDYVSGNFFLSLQS